MDITSNSKKALVWGGFTIVSLFLGYVAYSLYKQYKLIQKIAIKFDSITILSISAGEVGLGVTLSINNVSNLNINVNELNFDIYLNDKYINKILQKTTQDIPSKTTSKIRFNVYFKPLDVISNIDFSQLGNLNINSIRLKIVGYVSGSVDGINIQNFPITNNSKAFGLLKKFRVEINASKGNKAGGGGGGMGDNNNMSGINNETSN